MNRENCALKLVDEIILYNDARSKKHQIANVCHCTRFKIDALIQRAPSVTHNNSYCFLID